MPHILLSICNYMSNFSISTSVKYKCTPHKSQILNYNILTEPTKCNK